MDYSILRVGDLVIDRIDHVVTCGVISFDMSLLRFRALDELAWSANETVEYATLMQRVWRENQPGDINALAVHISQLRNDLREIRSIVDIRSVRGCGYSLVTPAGEAYRITVNGEALASS